MWLSLVERGKLRISKETEEKILIAIVRLVEFDRAVQASKELLVQDLRLPTVRSGGEVERKD